jgi:hypothetical protein
VQTVKIEQLISPQVQAFIRENEHADERELILRKPEIFGIPTPLVATQIAGRKKAKSKLPLYYSTPGIVYPPSVNLQQSSSQATAQFKAQQAELMISSPQIIVDLSGGLGIDTYFFSQKFSRVIYVEPDLSLLEIARQNHRTLGALNIEHVNLTAEDFLAQWEGKADLMYVDPSRRTQGDQKVHGFRHCQPDLIELSWVIGKKSAVLMVKASPLLDIKAALGDLSFVTDVTVLALDNDCKELIFIVKPPNTLSPHIKAVNITAGKKEFFSFTLAEENAADSIYSLPKQYLYEPNVAILKAGAFKLVGRENGLAKLDVNSHLYTSDKIIMDFPGRIFEVDAKISPTPGAAAAAFPEKRANIIVRNYPLSVNEIRKKLKIAEGGEKFLLGTSSRGKNFLLASTRLK